MKLHRMLPVIVGGILLSACATPYQVAEVQDIASIKATGGTAFTKALTEEYKAAATYEAEVESEWKHAYVFATKAKAAAGGEAVAPEQLTDWELPADIQESLATSRAQLMADFESGARDRLPELAAKVQANFDCWVEEEAEGETNSECKAAFLDGEPKLRPSLEPLRFVVYFGNDSVALNDAAMKVINDVVAANGTFKPAHIRLAGHTDTVGSARYNQMLSEKRAAAVAAALGKHGIQATTLDSSAYGKTKLAVPTGENTPKSENRRVEIILEK